MTLITIFLKKAQIYFQMIFYLDNLCKTNFTNLEFKSEFIINDSN